MLHSKARHARKRYYLLVGHLGRKKRISFHLFFKLLLDLMEHLTLAYHCYIHKSDCGISGKVNSKLAVDIYRWTQNFHSS